MKAMLFVLLILLASMRLACRLAVRPSGNIVMNLTLPKERLRDPEVLFVTRAYSRANRRLLALWGLLFLPELILWKYSPAEMLFLLLWVLGGMAAQQLQYRRYILRLHALKKARGWLGTVKKGTVLIDTSVTREKYRAPVPPYRLLLALLACALLLVLFFQSGIPGRYAGRPVLLMSGITVLLLALLYGFAFFGRAKIFTVSGDCNLCVNRMEKRVWSLSIFAALLLLDAALAAELLSFLARGISLGGNLFLSACGAACGLTGCTAAAVHIHTRRILLEAEGDFVEDDDACWLNGFYCNPADPALFVPRRTGSGRELNWGRQPAAGLLIGCIAAALALTIGFKVIYPLAAVSADGVQTEIGADGRLEFKVPGYRLAISRGEVERISWEENVKRNGVMKIDGLDTARYTIGWHSSYAFGTGMWYLDNLTEAAVCIRLYNGDYILINRASEDETEDFYQKLQNWEE